MDTSSVSSSRWVDPPLSSYEVFSPPVGNRSIAIHLAGSSSHPSDICTRYLESLSDGNRIEIDAENERFSEAILSLAKGLSSTINIERIRAFSTRRLSVGAALVRFFATVKQMRIGLMKAFFEDQKMAPLEVPVNSISHLVINDTAYRPCFQFQSNTTLFGALVITYDLEDSAFFYSQRNSNAFYVIPPPAYVPVESLPQRATAQLIKDYLHGVYPESYLHVIAERVLGDFYKEPPNKRKREDDGEGPAAKEARTDIVV
jgi:hypothetical protein